MRNIFKRKNKTPEVNNRVVNFNPKQRQAIPRRKSPSKIKVNVSDGSKRIIAGVIGFLIIILLMTALFSILSSPKYYISEFSIIGNKSVTEDSLNQILSEYKDKSIFLTSSSSIENKLLDNFVFFKSVKVRKEWPNTIKININEREPKLVMINLNGSYLIDEDGRIIDIISTKSINFSDDNLDIIAGLGDPNADYVINILELELVDEGIIDPTDEEQEEFDYSTIPLSRKLEILESLENDLRSRAEENFTLFNEETANSKYASLQRVFVYENIEYKQFDFINKELMLLSLEVSGFFNTPDTPQITQLLWEGDYLANIKLDNGKEIIFGTARNISEQLEDYTIIINELKINGVDYSRIDLSSKKISVR